MPFLKNVRLNKDIVRDMDKVVLQLKKRRRKWTGNAVVNVALREFFVSLARKSDEEIDKLFAQYEKGIERWEEPKLTR